MVAAVRVRGLTFRQAALTLAVTLLVGGGVTAAQAWLTLDAERSAAAERIGLLLDAARGNAAAAAFRLDARLAEYVARGLAASDAVASATIRDEGGALLATADGTQANNAPVWLVSLAYGNLEPREEALQALDRPGLRVGTLVIHPDRGALAAGFIRNLRQQVLIDAAKALLLALVLSILFYLALTRPLLRLASAVREVAPGEDRTLRDLGDLRNRDDELARVVASFEDQLTRFQTLLDERGKLLDDLRLRNAAIASMDSCVLIVSTEDPQLPIVDANAAVSALTGVPRSGLVGSNFKDFVERRRRSPEEYRRLEAFIAAGFAGSARAGVFEIFGVDGAPRWCMVSIVPVADGTGAQTHRVVILNDITEARETEERLRHSQKMDALGKVAGGIAHDFNNILAIMKGNLDLAQLDLTDQPDTARRLGVVERSVDRAAELTRRLLRFSRKTPVQERDVPVDALIGQMHDMLRSSLTPEISVELDLAAGDATVRIDAGDLEDALLNLAVNARDAMPDGGTLTVASRVAELASGDALLREGMAPGAHVLVTVSDTGTGMDEATRARLFEPFFTTKEEGRGTGLGLAQVYGFVERSGGHVEVASRPGQGSRFTLVLPEASAPALDDTAELGGAAMPGGRETVLVVDDEAELLEVAREVLEHLGYRVLAATDPAEALALFDAHADEVDLLLSDVVMPGGMNGYELAAQLVAQRPALRVLMVSGYASKRIARQARWPQLAKPWSVTDLALKVREVLDRGHTAV